MNKKCVQKKNSLNNYGKFISVYRGSGTVSIIDGAGEKPHQCSFEAGQRIDGKIFLLCHDLPHGLHAFFHFGMLAKKFEGITEEGFLVKSNEAEKGLIRIRYLPKSIGGLYDQNLALKLTELSVAFSEEKYHELHFGISNFQFDEADFQNNENETIVIVPLSTEEKIEISFKKLNNYANKISRISKLRIIDVTCEFIFKIPNLNDLNKLIELIDDICFLLSVKNGTKISWVYYDVYDKNGKQIFRKHALKVTKIYQPLDIFYFCENCPVQTKEFLEDSYQNFMKYREPLRLKRGVIDAYLDAKAETDYIETRGGKIALAIEYLKNEYLASKGEYSEYTFPPQEFKKSIPSISTSIIDSLKYQGATDKNKIQSISSEQKIEGLNRRSFGSILKEIIKEFHVNITSDEITLFIKCRNSLVQ